MGGKVMSKGESVSLDKVQRIKMCIDERKRTGSYTNCRLYITTPKLGVERDMYSPTTPIMQEVKGILERNKADYKVVDTVAGTFNLNREFMETAIIPCAVEFTGVYPLSWDVEGVARLEELEQGGDITILVSCYDDNGEYLGMNA